MDHTTDTDSTDTTRFVPANQSTSVTAAQLAEVWVQAVCLSESKAVAGADGELERASGWNG